MSLQQTPQQILSSVFGYSHFRDGQLEIIEHVLAGKDALAILPTGGGKSVCFQVPGLVKGALTLVITPLIALMKDQVLQLRKRNVPALAVFSGMHYREVQKAFINACSGEFRFLYLSPERLLTNQFREMVPAMPVKLIAVDEAHCISQWGHDFRPAYRNIAKLREALPGVPMLALTASATVKVQQDIREQLEFGADAQVFAQPFLRPNLSYSAFCEHQKPGRIVSILQSVPGSALVYCRSRRRTSDLAEHLDRHGIAANFYHAGLNSTLREARQTEWLSGKLRVMVCTNAFGMGIDKSDVRLVIHADIPETLEAYYQEAGRAGRDGRKAYGVMLYNKEELELLRQLPQRKFLPLSKVKELYQHIAHYLQLEEGKGEFQNYDFQLSEFCERFKYQEQAVLHGLQVLQQAGYVQYSDQVFMPATVHISASRTEIEEAEILHKELEPLLKLMLRTYEGITDYPVAIREKSLAFYLKWSPEMVTTALLKLASLNVLKYKQLEENPQLTYLQPRVQSGRLILNEVHYRDRKKACEQQVAAIIDYALLPTNCRSTFLASYFADKSQKRCGVCDNCLKAKRTETAYKEITAVAEHILLIVKKPQTLLQVRQNSLHVSGKIFELAIEQLLEEEQLEQLPDGRFLRKALLKKK